MSAAARSAPPRPALRAATPGAVWLLCALALALALAWSVAVPIFRAPQEIGHVDLARAVAGGSGYPDPGERHLSRQIVSAGQQAGFWTDFSDSPSSSPDRGVRYRVADAPERQARESFRSLAPPGATSPVVNRMSQHPPLYYGAAGGVLSLLPATTAYDVQVWLLRLLSALAVAPLPWLAWAAARWLVEDQRAALAAAVVPVAIPMLAHAGGSAGNDAPLALLGGVFALGLARLTAGDARGGTAALLGLAAGLGLLVKVWALAWLVALPVAAVVAVRRGLVTPRSATACAGAAGVVAAAVGGWWWVRNVARFGALQPTVGSMPEVAERLDVGGWLVLAASRLVLRFWGHFGWGEVALPWPVVWAATAAVAVAVGAAVAARRGAAAGLRGPAVAMLAPLAATVVLVVGRAARLYAASGAPEGLQGRYLVGGVIGLAVVVGMGATALAGWRARWLPVGILGLAAALQLTGGWLALAHWWGPPNPDTSVLAVRAALAWSPLPDGAVVGLVVLVLAGFAAAGVLLVRQARTARPTPRRRRARRPATP